MDSSNPPFYHKGRSHTLRNLLGAAQRMPSPYSRPQCAVVCPPAVHAANRSSSQAAVRYLATQRRLYCTHATSPTGPAKLRRCATSILASSRARSWCIPADASFVIFSNVCAAARRLRSDAARAASRRHCSRSSASTEALLPIAMTLDPVV